MPQLCPGVVTQLRGTASSFLLLRHLASQVPVKHPSSYTHVCLLGVGTWEHEALAVKLFGPDTKLGDSGTHEMLDICMMNWAGVVSRQLTPLEIS